MNFNKTWIYKNVNLTWWKMPQSNQAADMPFLFLIIIKSYKYLKFYSLYKECLFQDFNIIF